jgi:hypothetical protein
MVDAILFAAHMVFGGVVVVGAPRIDRAAAAEAEAEKCGPPPARRCLAAPPTPPVATLGESRCRPLRFSTTSTPKSDHNPRPALATRHRLSSSRFSPVFAPHCHLCGRHYRRNCPRPRPNWANPTPPPPSLARGPHLSDKAPLFLVAHNHRPRQARRPVSVSALIGMSKSPRPKSLLSPIPVRM